MLFFYPAFSLCAHTQTHTRTLMETHKHNLLSTLPYNLFLYVEKMVQQNKMKYYKYRKNKSYMFRLY